MSKIHKRSDLILSILDSNIGLKLKSKQFFAVTSTLITRAIAASLQFILNVILGRLLGSVGLGNYYLFVSWLNVFSTVESFGLPTLTLNRISGLVAKKDHATAYQFWRCAILLLSITTILFAFLAHSFNTILAKLLFRDASLNYIISFIGWAAVPFSIIGLASASLKAFKRPALSVCLQFALVPAGLILFSSVLFFTEKTHESITILGGYTMLLCVSTVMSLMIMHYLFALNRSKAGYNKKRDRLISLPDVSRFWFIALLAQGVANLPFVLLPYFGSQSEIGLYGVANRLVSLATLILVALSNVYAPIFTEAHILKQKTRLKQLLKHSQIYSTMAYLPLFLVFIFGSEWVLGLFGHEFVKAKYYLWVLAGGQLINSITGLVGFLNIMTGHEVFEIRLGVLTIFGFIFLSFSLGSSFGALGIAIASSAAIAIKNLISYIRLMVLIKIK